MQRALVTILAYNLTKTAKATPKSGALAVGVKQTNMKHLILFLTLLCVAGCANTKAIRDEHLIGMWTHRWDNEATTYFEFRPDKSGTYGVGKSFQECDCGHEFTWSNNRNIISTVGYDGLEIDGEYQEVIVKIELVGIYKNGQLIKLKPKHNDYQLVKEK